jgi:uncharacterized membrane protein HdeD (DUF308 family)
MNSSDTLTIVISVLGGIVIIIWGILAITRARHSEQKRGKPSRPLRLIAIVFGIVILGFMYLDNLSNRTINYWLLIPAIALIAYGISGLFGVDVN